VYLARWAGRQVAVKVIEHSGDTSAVVENEVKLMMQVRGDAMWWCLWYNTVIPAV
jgi:hypothetical protein